MGRTEKYLAMPTDMSDSELIGSDLNELGSAARKLVSHAFHLSGGLSLVVIGTILLQSLASIAGIFLVVLSNTKLKTKMFTALLVPYIFCSIPNLPFAILSGEVGHYIAFVLTTIRLFFPQHSPEWSEIPNALGTLLVIAPDFIAHTIREGIVGVLICLVISVYLLQEHIRASGGFRNCFAKPHGISNTVGLIFLVLYPIWGVIVFFF
ncbi:cold-regulated 413 plasma membrane protein 2-like protein [Carex littledalei]|uniref:Cold-regulated 413 plasma membrane protein 2-like protein n=1 Tax=Carex littledalei TaxID=544730 RepID=A0A833V3H5_9POAL|nr:cold-regulated 413 plasma membrane protein 2-like protein [Carex littledalei]